MVVQPAPWQLILSDFLPLCLWLSLWNFHKDSEKRAWNFLVDVQRRQWGKCNRGLRGLDFLWSHVLKDQWKKKSRVIHWWEIMCTKVQWRVGTARGHWGEQERLRELGRCFGRLGIPNCSYNQWGNTGLLCCTHLSGGKWHGPERRKSTAYAPG